jgi:hypothetical protein
MDKKTLEKARETIINNTAMIITAQQIVNKDYGPETWTVDRLIPELSITAITGIQGSYKTWITLEIARCVGSGTDFLGKFKVTNGNVLIIDKENQLRHIKKRLKMLAIEKEPIFYFERAEDFLIDNDKDYKILLDIIEKLKIKLVIFDSLVRIHNGEENVSRDIAKVINAFRKITNKGVTVIFIHHNRKEKNEQSSPNSVRGSSDILGGIDSLLQIKKIGKRQLNITQSKLRQDEETLPFKVDMNLDNASGTAKFEYGGSADTLPFEAKIEIQKIFEDGKEIDRQELAELFNEKYGPKVINEMLKSLVEAGIIMKKVGAHNKHSYILNNHTSTEMGCITNVVETITKSDA